MDHLTVSKRSWNMSLIKSKGTLPEKRVLLFLRAKKLRFKQYDCLLPGKPDFILAREKSAIFVHGCFWHSHRGCSRANLPKTNKNYWLKKLERNVTRDRKNKRELRLMGWKVIVIWECQTKSSVLLENKIFKGINSTKKKC